MRNVLITFLIFHSQFVLAAGAPVFVDRAVKSPVQSGTTVTGRVVAGEIHTLSAQISESVKSIRVRVGDVIQAGEEIIRLDGTEIRNQLKGLKIQRVYLTAHLSLLQKRMRLREKQLARAESLTIRDLLTRDVTEQAELNVIETQSDIVKTTYDLEDLKIRLTDVERRLSHTLIRAETAGRIIEVSVTDGQYVRAGDQLFRVLPDLGVEVEVEVRPEVYETAKVGQVVSGQLRKNAHDLKVRALLAEQNQRTGSRIIRLQFISQQTNTLVLGEPIELKLPIGKMLDQITIAKDAVIPGKKGHRVVVVVGGKVEIRRVELGAGVGERIAVLNGVKSDEVVVTQGQEGLRKGQKVSVIGDRP